MRRESGSPGRFILRIILTSSGNPNPKVVLPLAEVVVEPGTRNDPSNLIVIKTVG